MLTEKSVTIDLTFDPIFENQKRIMRPRELAQLLGISTKTIYDWKYRARSKRVPDGLFVKFNGQLFVRTDILKSWISAQNPCRG